MAHKKGVGSSKNGRESESKRLGIKIFGGQYAQGRVIFWFVREVLFIIPEKTWVLEKTIRCSHW